MVVFYLVVIFLGAYIDQHGPYLNVFDVMLMSVAGVFVLFIVFIIIMAIIDQIRK